MIRERRLPRWPRSVFRETAEVVTVSVVAGTIGFAISLWFWDARSEFSARNLLVDSVAYYRSEPFLTIGWLLTSAVLATAFAIAAAFVNLWVVHSAPGTRRNLSVWYSTFFLAQRGTESNSFGLIITEDPGTLVVCQLDDGTQMSGICIAYDDEPGQEGKRDMVLAAPMLICTPTDESQGRRAQLHEFNRVVLNEQHIRWWASKLLDSKAKRQYVNVVYQRREELKGRNRPLGSKYHRSVS